VSGANKSGANSPAPKLERQAAAPLEELVGCPLTAAPEATPVVSGRAASEQRGAAGRWRRREGEGGISWTGFL